MVYSCTSACDAPHWQIGSCKNLEFILPVLIKRGLKHERRAIGRSGSFEPFNLNSKAFYGEAGKAQAKLEVSESWIMDHGCWDVGIEG